MEHKHKSITFSRVKNEERWRIQVSVFGLVFVISNTPMRFQSRQTVKHCVDKKNRIKMRLLIERGCRCEMCGADLTNKDPEVHHIKPQSLYPELKYEISNLMVLCHACHAGVHQRKMETAYGSEGSV